MDVSIEDIAVDFEVAEHLLVLIDGFNLSLSLLLLFIVRVWVCKCESFHIFKNLIFYYDY